MGNVKERLEGKTLYTEYDYNLAGNLLAVYRGKPMQGNGMQLSGWTMISGEI